MAVPSTTHTTCSVTAKTFVLGVTLTVATGSPVSRSRRFSSLVAISSTNSAVLFAARRVDSAGADTSGEAFMPVPPYSMSVCPCVK